LASLDGLKEFARFENLKNVSQPVTLARSYWLAMASEAMGDKKQLSGIKRGKISDIFTDTIIHKHRI
jgi:hypothetical protein